jgi:tetratricopeptide (TPR) repeat protein
LGVPDSAAKYYRAAVAICPEADTNRARYLYAEAAIAGLERRASKAVNKSAKSTSDSVELAKAHLADSLLKAIVTLYPLTQQGIDARIRLGYTEQFLVDSLADMMQSADRFRQIKQYGKALQKYNLIAGRYADSKYAPRAVYAQGWLYERELGKRDSAVYWYSRLVEKYPQSSFAKDVKPGLDGLLAERRLQDSLKALPKLPVVSGSTMATLQASTGTINTASTNATLQAPAPLQRRR